MKLFKTTSRRTYRKPRQRAGWSTTLTAKTRAKRWAKRGTKKLWRTAKQRIRRRWRRSGVYRRWNQRSSAVRRREIARRKRQLARTAQRIGRQYANTQAQSTSGYQVDASGAVSYQPGPAQVAGGQAKLPPPDGAMASCRRCSNEVMYNGNRQRWEHTGRGNAECFQRRAA